MSLLQYSQLFDFRDPKPTTKKQAFVKITDLLDRFHVINN